MLRLSRQIALIAGLLLGPGIIAQSASVAGSLGEVGRSEGTLPEFEVAALLRLVPRMPKPVKPAVGVFPRAALAPGDVFRDCLECPEMVVLPAGRFTMGSPPDEEGRDDDEGPLRDARIEAFAISRYEVTRDQYARFVEAMDYEPPDGCWVVEGDEWAFDEARTWRDPGFAQGMDHPVTCVSHVDARVYAGWLSRMAGNGHRYRLPSEAEWEYAARARTPTRFAWGRHPDAGCDFANGADVSATAAFPARTAMTCDDGHIHTAAVGSFAGNAFGLHDLSGNLWEWVEDCWSESYEGAPTDGSASLEGDCLRRVLRGGSWHSPPKKLRPASRGYRHPGVRDFDNGFRVVRALGP